MKITFVTPQPTLNGGTKVIAIHAQGLARRGHEVTVVSQPHRTISTAHKIKSLLRGKGWPPDPGLQPSHFDGTSLKPHVIDRRRPVTDDDIPDGDVVIATWWETAEWVNALSATKGARAYFIQHHEVFDYLPIDRCQATYRLPLHKIVVANWLREVMAQDYGDHDVDVVPNSVDTEQFFAPPRGKQECPTVGLLYSRAVFKAVDASLAALQNIRPMIKDLRVIAFGSERPSGQFQLPDNAEFHFCPNQNEIRNIYARCDVWLTASRSEGFNLPAMEAMACRAPVVSTRAGWPAEAIISGSNGVLTDIDDVPALARAVKWVLMRTDAEWRELSANAHATAAQGSWDESVVLFERALERTIAQSA
ncbi:MAG: glycosyltransferase family 4 protein [Hyphomicrobium sp.]|uniref:glycosyltransferase family 4 protein n=1 Tax=Hyphomicrobium sp. TaxID=82 RepID=UPI0039E4C6FC